MDDVPAHATTILDLSTLLGIDAVTHEIVASELTPDDVGDVSEMPALLNQIDADVASMTADGAYDGLLVADFQKGRIRRQLTGIVLFGSGHLSRSTVSCSRRRGCRHVSAGRAFRRN
jgi:hypothetical protein